MGDKAANTQSMIEAVGLSKFYGPFAAPMVRAKAPR